MRVAAVDLGASTVRVAVVDADAPHVVEVVHRYDHQPVAHDDGTLRWEWGRLADEVEHGLTTALSGGALDSIGVAAAGSDYGLLDDAGALVAAPFSCGDARTDRWRVIAERLGEKRLFTETGVHPGPTNTIFQLAVHDRVELARAAHVLLLPELLVHHLTGAVTAEVTSASTTGLVSLHTGTWDDELVEEIELPRALLPPISAPGTTVGAWQDVPVRLVAGNTTASAVHARPGGRGEHRAFVSTDGDVVVGTERAEPCTTRIARLAEFSNERSAEGGYLFRKRLTGVALVERCREQWHGASFEELVALAAKARGGVVVNTDDSRLHGVASVPKAIADVSELDADDRGGIVRCIFESIAAAIAGALEQLSHVTGAAVTEFDLVGDATGVPLLVDLITTATPLPCTVGSPAAALLGNARAQFAAYTDGGGL